MAEDRAEMTRFHVVILDKAMTLPKKIDLCKNCFLIVSDFIEKNE